MVYNNSNIEFVHSRISLRILRATCSKQKPKRWGCSRRFIPQAFKQKLRIWILKQKRDGVVYSWARPGKGRFQSRLKDNSSALYFFSSCLAFTGATSLMSRLSPYPGLCLLILSDFPSPQIFYEVASTSRTIKSRNLGEDLAARTRPGLACLHTSFAKYREKQKHRPLPRLLIRGHEGAWFSSWSSR